MLHVIFHDYEKGSVNMRVVNRPWRIMLKNQAIMLCSYASYYRPLCSGLGTVMLH